MKTIVLVVNNFSWFGKRAFRTWLPAIPILTSIIKEHYSFKVLDANVNEWDFDETEFQIHQTNADMILISALSIDYQKQYHKLAELAKKALPDCITLVGGVYPTSLPLQVLDDPNVDYIIQGFAEGRLLPFIDAIFKHNNDYLYSHSGIGFYDNGKKYFEPLNSFLADKPIIVQPDYSQIDIEKYFRMQEIYSAKNYSTECSEKRSVNIISSYGCPYNCFFCANRSLTGSKVVYRPVDDVLNEIDYFVTSHNVKQISFMDDNIVSDKPRAKALFTELRNRNYGLEIQIGNLAAWNLDDEILHLLKDVGCTRIGISVESGSQHVLHKIMHKPLNLEIIPPLVKKFKELGIMMIADFIIGLPGETWNDIKMSLNYADNMDADLCNINIAVPYPGTDMHSYMVQHNMLPDNFEFDDKFFVTGLVSTNEFIPSELKIIAAFEWEKINAGSPTKRERAKKVLRLSDSELDLYCKEMRRNALRFVKNHG